MELIISRDLKENKLEVVFCPVFEDNEKLAKAFSYFAKNQEISLISQAKKEKFQGQKKHLFIMRLEDKLVVLIGLGKIRRLVSEDWREAGAMAISYLQKYQAKNIGIIASQWLQGSSDYDRLAQSLAEGLYLTSYKFDKYKKIDKQSIQINIEQIFVELAKEKKNNFIKNWALGEAMSSGTILARGLVNEPANVMTPTYLADVAIDIAKNNKQIRVKILDKEQVEKIGMNAFLAVDRGSHEPLKFIHLVYKPKTKTKEKIALVGKGLTFDSGGLNIKTGDSMYQMKIDMAGAATVLGIFSVLEQFNIKAEVHGLIAACENMPSDKAMRPGDIVRNLQGKSIEIWNTDAEGRVTLADSLAYAQKIGIKKIVDLATLTGAVMVALGPNVAGLFSNNEKLGQEIKKASEMAGEKMWSLPLEDDYREYNKSQVADIRNASTTRYGGAITAALFLQEFINEGVIWAHLDIAAPAYAEKPLNAYTPVGGVGYGVRTLLEWLCQV
jgi:leucyl aminopeptidase